eukprot:m.10293 g.10293  ORF g.10293 m.10293 type:complete len:343 (+) comp5537_c0_seq1:135-1163(+)
MQQPRLCAGFAVLFSLCLLTGVGGRIHHLTLKDEHRDFVVISSFGLLLGGHVSVTVSNATATDTRVGFVLTKANEEATEYRLHAESSCALDPPTNRTKSIDPTAQAQIRLELNLGKDTKKPLISWQPFSTPVGNVLVTATNISNTSAGFEMSLADPLAEDLYTITYVACLSSGAIASASMVLDIVEVNPGNEYLGAGEDQLPLMYGVMSTMFLVLAAIWLQSLCKQRKSPHLTRVHWLMLGLVICKALTLAFHSIDYHFISMLGHQKEGWAVIFYVISFLKVPVRPASCSFYQSYDGKTVLLFPSPHPNFGIDATACIQACQLQVYISFFFVVVCSTFYDYL